MKWLEKPTGPGLYHYRIPMSDAVRFGTVYEDGLRFRMEDGTDISVSMLGGQWLPIPSPDVLIALGACEEACVWYGDDASNYRDGVPGLPMDVDDDSGFDWEHDSGARAYAATAALDAARTK